MVKVEDSGGDEVRSVVLLSNSEDELTKAYEAYMKDYPANAYMTMVVDKGQQMDGWYYIRLWRRASCD